MNVQTSMLQVHRARFDTVGRASWVVGRILVILSILALFLSLIHISEPTRPY